MEVVNDCSFYEKSRHLQRFNPVCESHRFFLSQKDSELQSMYYLCLHVSEIVGGTKYESNLSAFAINGNSIKRQMAKSHDQVSLSVFVYPSFKN